MLMTKKIIQTMLDHLINQGITVSLVYGPCGDKGILWSVDVLTQDQHSFEMPFAANTHEKAIVIAFLECCERGWAMPLEEFYSFPIVEFCYQ